MLALPRRNKIFAFVLIASLLPLSVRSVAGHIRSIKAYGKKYVYLRDVANYYGMKCFIWKKKCGMYSKYSRIEFTYHKKEGEINGIKVHYLHAPFLKGFDAFISEQDFLKVVDPVMRGKALSAHRMKVIMIDPGHGAEDKGGEGRIYEEKKLVLQIALRLRDILKAHGYIVLMTRERDKFISLGKRAVEATRRHADIFVSIHMNIASDRNVKGIETFVMTPAGAASTHDRKTNWRRENGNSFDKNNLRLGYEIHKSMIKKTKAPDRGVKRARFVVLKDAPCPAVLLETGFLSNPKEERALGRGSYQQTLALAIAEGIIKYSRAVKKGR